MLQTGNTSGRADKTRPAIMMCCVAGTIGRERGDAAWDITSENRESHVPLIAWFKLYKKSGLWLEKAVYISKTSNFYTVYTPRPESQNKETKTRNLAMILLKQQPRCLSLKCKWKKLWLASSAVTADSFLQDQPSRQVVSWLISCRNRSFFLADQMSQQVVH